MAEACGYCGRFMATVDYGLEYGSEFVCSQQEQHIADDPEHWTIGSLEMAVRVAKRRAGLDPDQQHVTNLYAEHIDEEWKLPFWEMILGKVEAQMFPAPETEQENTR